MLVLSRKENERLVIADNIIVQILRVSGGNVRLGIEAPAEVPIRREELARHTPHVARTLSQANNSPSPRNHGSQVARPLRR
jgi:carbon storage regulator